MRLRFFFDAGAGACLWAHDDEARARFGYPVAAADLDIPAELQAEIDQLVADYDDSFPWDDPGGGGAELVRTTLGYEENPPFITRVGALLPKLRAALGAAFVIDSDYDA